MTDRCEPPEHLRDVDGWHWVSERGVDVFIARWRAAPHNGLEPLWINLLSGPAGTPKWVASEWKWRYIAPVSTPAEVEALRAELDDWKRKAGEGWQAASDEAQKADAIRDRLEALQDVLDEGDAENTTLRARVEALETALCRIVDGDHPEGTSLAVNGNYRELSARFQAIARAALEIKP